MTIHSQDCFLLQSSGLLTFLFTSPGLPPEKHAKRLCTTLHERTLQELLTGLKTTDTILEDISD